MMTKLLLILLSLNTFGFNYSQAKLIDNSLKPFFTDGCTLFVDGPPNKPGLWRDCCILHDMRYWYGGNQSNMNQADLNLKSCVNSVAGSKWAELLYLGVRTGHHSPIRNKTHWSWGWLTPRALSELTVSENEYVKTEIERLNIDQKLIDRFLKENFPQ